jgi:hypothetical protein
VKVRRTRTRARRRRADVDRIISDKVLSSETGKSTEFVVVMSGEPQGASKTDTTLQRVNATSVQAIALLIGARRSRVRIRPGKPGFSWLTHITSKLSISVCAKTRYRQAASSDVLTRDARIVGLLFGQYSCSQSKISFK